MSLPDIVIELINALDDLWVYDIHANPKHTDSRFGEYRLIAPPGQFNKVKAILPDLNLTVPYTLEERMWISSGAPGYDLIIHFGTIQTVLGYMQGRHLWLWQPRSGVRMKVQCSGPLEHPLLKPLARPSVMGSIIDHVAGRKLMTSVVRPSRKLMTSVVRPKSE